MHVEGELIEIGRSVNGGWRIVMTGDETRCVEITGLGEKEIRALGRHLYERVCVELTVQMDGDIYIPVN